MFAGMLSSTRNRSGRMISIKLEELECIAVFANSALWRNVESKLEVGCWILEISRASLKSNHLLLTFYSTFWWLLIKTKWNWPFKRLLHLSRPWSWAPDLWPSFFVNVHSISAFFKLNTGWFTLCDCDYRCFKIGSKIEKNNSVSPNCLKWRHSPEAYLQASVTSTMKLFC